MHHSPTDEICTISALDQTHHDILATSYLYVTLKTRRQRIAHVQPRSNRQRDASRYRASQLSILTLNLHSLAYFLNFLRRSTHFVSLSDVLTSSAAGLNVEFRTAVHSSLRTRQAASPQDDFDDGEKDELKAVAASCMPIVQTAAERDPGSLYADERWTKAFLMWGLRVWKNGCVSIPMEIVGERMGLEQGYS